MSRVNITLVSCVVSESPVAVVLFPEWVEVVDVCTLYVDDLSEETLLSHIQGCHFEEVIYTVLKHHAVLAGLL